MLAPLAPTVLDIALEIWSDPEVVAYFCGLMDRDTINEYGYLDTNMKTQCAAENSEQLHLKIESS